MNRGLIEAYVVEWLGAVPSALPRFMNRGLIEASMISTARSAFSVLPRFMNRGLIEARYPIRRHHTQEEDFPDS